MLSRGKSCNFAALFPDMQLVMDIGNSRTKIGLFHQQRLVEQAIWTDWTLEELRGWADRSGVNSIIYASVRDPDPQLKEMLEEDFRVVELTEDTPLPFTNTYQTPRTLGKDRLAAVAGAWRLYPGKDCMVVDCGTCIKYEVLTAEGVYLGGNIAPGLRMRLRAMHHFTARLPEAEMVMPDREVGYSTETALQNGALRGGILEIGAYYGVLRAAYPDMLLVLTGGDAFFVNEHLDVANRRVEDNLLLYGLDAILSHIQTL